ncbi:MAG: sulfatase-like hydrolase/transferase [Gammaproteobacteria bacterium]|nr:MAG: sulfatase-like hydrolase/transferase [Gammaproteobacteria bacterium]
MRPQILSRLINHYFFATYFVVLVVLSANLQKINILDLRSGLFTTTVFLTYGFIYLLPALILCKLGVRLYSWVPGRPALLRKMIYGIAVLLTSLTLVMLYADHSIYSIFGFHLNGFVWNLLTTPGGIESMGGSGSSMLTYALYVAGFFVFQSAMLLVLLRLYVKRAACNNLHHKIIYRYILAIFILATLGERVTYGVSSIQGHTPVLAASNAFPFYLPMTFRSWAKKLGIDTRRSQYGHMRVKGSQLAYPRVPLNVKTKDTPLNIIWLVAESLRADMLTAEIMPATWAFAGKSHRFTNHYSGSNMTRMGMFSMFYGLHGSYWFSFLEARRSPVLMDIIQQQNYQYEMYTSAVFTYPEIDKTIFSNIESSHLHEAPAATGWGSDQVNVGKLIDFIENRDPSRPFMTFMFFESPHSRYYFPDESIIRTDYLDDFNYATSINKEKMPLIKNRYINSVHHLDSQIGRVLDYVKKKNLAENTIILITGDHGEEFMEKGRWGHGSQFTEEQLKVPLVLWVPGTGASVVTRMTSHIDIPATLLPYLGVTNQPADYSLGYDLLGDHTRKYTVVSDWNNIGYIGSAYKAVLPLKSAGFIDNRVTTHDDMPVDDEATFFAEKQDRIVSIMRELAIFTQIGREK